MEGTLFSDGPSHVAVDTGALGRTPVRCRSLLFGVRRANGHAGRANHLATRPMYEPHLATTLPFGLTPHLPTSSLPAS